MTPHKHYVMKTECYPKPFHVTCDPVPSGDNSWVNFFETEKEAQDEADKRNRLTKDCNLW